MRNKGDGQVKEFEICKGTLAVGDTLLHDVQLWSKAHRTNVKIDELVYLACVDQRRIPLWMVNGGAVRLYTDNQNTVKYLQKTLADNASLLFHTPDDGQFIVYAHEERVYGSCLRIFKGPAEGISIDTDDDPSARFISMPEDEVPSSTKLKHAAALDRALVNPRRNSFNLPTVRRTSSASKPTLLKESSNLSRGESPAVGLRETKNSEPRQESAAPLSPHEQAAKESVQKLVMSGLRIRGLTTKDDEYKAIYQHASRAAIFALRKQIGLKHPDVIVMQEMVERLLCIFV